MGIVWNFFRHAIKVINRLLFSALCVVSSVQNKVNNEMTLMQDTKQVAMEPEEELKKPLDDEDDTLPAMNHRSLKMTRSVMFLHVLDCILRNWFELHGYKYIERFSNIDKSDNDL